MGKRWHSHEPGLQQRALGCYSAYSIRDVGDGDVCAESERQCDPLGHIVQLSVRC